MADVSDKKRGRPSRRRPGNESTIAFSADIEADDFIKVPRALVRMPRYLGQTTWDSLEIDVRHMMLLLVLAARKFQDKPIRAYWEELAEDLGVSKETVRKWAYRLQKSGLLQIVPHRGRKTEKVGYRNDRNEFRLDPFTEKLREAWNIREKDRHDRKRLKNGNEGAQDV